LGRCTDVAARIAGAGVLALAAAWPRAAVGQSLFERLNLDRLRLTALGASAGPVQPKRVKATQSYSVHADYGEITRPWQVVFLVTYWESEFRQREVDRLAEQIRSATIDPSRDDTVDVGRVTVSDIALETDLRWSPLRAAVLRPYLGGAFGAHVINAENKFISGTFVESALDNIAAGVTGLVGVDTAPLRGLSLMVQARYSLLSNMRFLTLRAGGSYYFAPPAPPAPAP
jgi:hypothetical protein